MIVGDFEGDELGDARGLLEGYDEGVAVTAFEGNELGVAEGSAGVTVGSFGSDCCTGGFGDTVIGLGVSLLRRIGAGVSDAIGDGVGAAIRDSVQISSLSSSPTTSSWRSRPSLLLVRSVPTASTPVESELPFLPKLSKSMLPNPPFPFFFSVLTNIRPAFPLPALPLPALPALPLPSLPFVSFGSLKSLEHPLDFLALATLPVAEVGARVGDTLSDVVGGFDVSDSMRDSVGDLVRKTVVFVVGTSVGDSVRKTVVNVVGTSVGDSVVNVVGNAVVIEVGEKVPNAEVGAMVPVAEVGASVDSAKRADKDTGEGLTGEAGELFDPFEEETTVSTSGFKTRWPFLEAAPDRRNMRTGMWSSCSSNGGS